MSTMPPWPVRLSAPQDILNAVPYLLGFHPADSLVLIGIKGERNKVGLTMRVDLDPVLPIDDTMPRLIDALVRDGCDKVIGVLYAPDEQLGQISADAIRLHLLVAGITVRDLFRVAEGRWWSYLCDDSNCCPTEGTPLVGGDHRVAATAVAAGLTAATDRATLLARLDPPSAELRADTRTAYHRLASYPSTFNDLRFIRELVTRFASERTPSATVVELAQVAYSMHDTTVRDGVLIWALDNEIVTPLQTLLLEVARYVGEAESVPAATVLAVIHYLRGNGAMAAVLLEYALSHEPGYSMALLFDRALNNGAHPDRIRDVLENTRSQLHPNQ